MIILGINWLSDASATVVRDGKIVAAISEERINRQKLWYGFPEKSIREVLALACIGIEDIDCISTYGLCPDEPDRKIYQDKENAIRAADITSTIKEHQLNALAVRREHEKSVFLNRPSKYHKKIKKFNRPLRIYAHHHAHAASAYYGSGWEECAVVSADGWGDAASGSVFLADRKQGLVPHSYSHTFDSLGYFYGSFTKSLGFIPHRHEGKVLGLAAYCQNPGSYKEIAPLIDVDLDELRFIGRMENGVYLPNFNNPAVDEIVSRYPREDIAAAVQTRLEEVVTALVTKLGERARNLALAGGIFANVKLNQRLGDLPNVDQVYVFPNMGDGGLGAGAACLAYHELTGDRPQPLSTMYLGPAPEVGEMEAALSKSGLSYTRKDNIQAAVANLLAKGEVVARCTGRMEFGPRALGHRSIFYQASDHSVNDWLNGRLGRSEFMPFAPATLAEAADEMYIGLSGCAGPAKFMAMTFDCTERMKKEAPAAVHVDGTARPQIVTAKDHPDTHEILVEYKALTGLSSIVNTSFNMHEEPIVMTAGDAVRAFVSSGLPYLALGDFLVTAPGKV